MSSLPIPTSSPDVEQLLQAALGQEFNGAPVRIVKSSQVAPYHCIVIRADLQNKATPISRYCRLAVSAWVVRSDGTADLKASRDLAGAYASAVERLSGGIVLSAEIESGPYRVEDPTGGPLYAVANLLLEVAV